jgi:hypothetical protein
MVRAVRDLIADLDTTLPALLERGDGTGLHFWFATFDGHRAALCPSAVAAYAAWRQGGDDRPLREVIARGREHFERVGRRLLALHSAEGEAAGPAIARLLSDPRTVCPR